MIMATELFATMPFTAFFFYVGLPVLAKFIEQMLRGLFR